MNFESLCVKMRGWCASGALFCVFSALFFAFVTNAEANDFIVRNHKVTIDNPNPVNVREKAMEKALRDGFSTLLRQLTPRETWSRHAGLLLRVNWDKVFYKSDLVSEVYGSNYQGVFNLYYQENEVKNFLTQNGVPYTLTSGGKVMVLPLLEQDGHTFLWETFNPLRTAMAANFSSQTYFEFILPEGKSRETSQLSADVVSLGAADIMLSIAKTYNAPAVVVFDAKVTQRFGSYYLDVSANWYEEGVEVEPTIYAAPIENTGETLGKVNETALRNALNAALKDVLPRLGDHKRNEKLIEVNRPGRVFLRFKPEGPKDLENLKDKVSSLSVIREFKLRVLNVKDSVFQVDFYGDVSGFRKALNDADIRVEETNIPMVWKINFKNNPFAGPVDYGF